MCIRDSVGVGLGKATEIPEAIRKGKEDAAKNPVSYTHLDVYKRQLEYNPRYASSLIKKLLESAIANAENNNGMNKDNLYVAQCYANKGPTIKRVHPRACLLYTSRCV